LVWDAEVRAIYAKEISKISKELARQVELSGKIAGEKATWAKAAEEANKARNATLSFIRRWSTPTGRAYAMKLKPEGLGLIDLIIKNFSKIHDGIYLDANSLKALSIIEKDKLYKSFEKPQATEKNKIYSEIVKSAGTPRNLMILGVDIKHWGTAGRGLLALSLALSVYNVAVAEDKVRAATREATITGASIGGAILSGTASGVIAETVCGPFAPACVAAGAFIGGALAAFGVSLLW